MKYCTLFFLLLLVPIAQAQDDGLQLLNMNKKGGLFLGTYSELGYDEGFEWSQSIHAEYNIWNHFTIKGIANMGRQHPSEMGYGYWMPGLGLSCRANIPINKGLWGYLPIEPTIFARYGGHFSQFEWNPQFVTGWSNNCWDIKFGLHHSCIQDLNTHSATTQKAINPVYLIKYVKATRMAFLSIRITNIDHLYTASYNRPGFGVCYTLPLLTDCFIWADLFYHSSERFSTVSDTYGLSLRIGFVIGDQ